MIVLISVGGALAVGLLLQRSLCRRTMHDSDGRADAEGLTAAELGVPLLTLVALILAFVLVESFSSYQDARDGAADEAAAVVVEAQAAHLLPSPAGPELVAALRCYARAVAGTGWESLEHHRRPDPISVDANDRVELALQHVRRTAGEAPVLSAALDADRERVENRRKSLAEAETSVPTAVTVLLIAMSAATVLAVAALADRRIRRSLKLPLLGMTGAGFAATVLVIFDLDRPFGGFATVKPTQMIEVEQIIGGDPLATDPPCDGRGVYR